MAGVLVDFVAGEGGGGEDPGSVVDGVAGGVEVSVVFGSV